MTLKNDLKNYFKMTSKVPQQDPQKIAGPVAQGVLDPLSLVSGVL